LDLENAFNTISRRSSLAELYKNPDLHPIVQLVEMIFTGLTVYNFDPDDASLLYGAIQSRAGVQQGDPRGPLLFNLAINTPSGVLGSGAMIHRRPKPSLTIANI
jgi:hypothetical protein